MAIKSNKKGFPFTNQTFSLCGIPLQSWQNDQIDIYQKTQKKKSTMIAMDFFLVNDLLL